MTMEFPHYFVPEGMTPTELRAIADMMSDDTGNWWGDYEVEMRAWAAELEGKAVPVSPNPELAE